MLNHGFKTPHVFFLTPSPSSPLPKSPKTKLVCPLMTMRRDSTLRLTCGQTPMSKPVRFKRQRHLVGPSPFGTSILP